MHGVFAKAINLTGGEYGIAILSKEEAVATNRVALAALPTNDAFGVDGSANVTKPTNQGKENDRCENYS